MSKSQPSLKQGVDKSLTSINNFKSWTSSEQVWTSHEQGMNKFWTSHEWIVNKSWTSHEQVMNKSWTSCEEVMNNLKTSHEQVVNNYLNFLLYFVGGWWVGGLVVPILLELRLGLSLAKRGRIMKISATDVITSWLLTWILTVICHHSSQYDNKITSRQFGHPFLILISFISFILSCCYIDEFGLER